jgi:hypothetical protein
VPRFTCVSWQRDRDVSRPYRYSPLGDKTRPRFRLNGAFTVGEQKVRAPVGGGRVPKQRIQSDVKSELRAASQESLKISSLPSNPDA